MWIRTKSISCQEFFHGMQEIIVADTPVTLFMGEDEQRPLAERVARFLPRVCANYTIIDTKELEMPGISPEFRGTLSHLMMHAVNNRVDAYMELFLRHPLSIRRYYRQFVELPVYGIVIAPAYHSKLVKVIRNQKTAVNKLIIERRDILSNHIRGVEQSLDFFT